MLRIDGRGNPSPTISNVIGWYKYNITKEINLTTGKIEKIFQRSFHDHIIRTEKEHLEIYEYIENNPFTWESDCFYNKYNLYTSYFALQSARLRYNKYR